MGASASLTEQKQLYGEIKEYVDKTIQDLDQVEDSDSNLNENTHDVEIYDAVNNIYQQWKFRQEIRSKSCLSKCPLLDFEYHVDKLFETGLTPFILDQSTDDKVITYYSYQPNVTIIECKTLISNHLLQKQPLIDSLEYCRRLLVNAMKNGKLLVINLGTFAPDFVNLFNDHELHNGSKHQDKISSSQTAKIHAATTAVTNGVTAPVNPDSSSKQASAAVANAAEELSHMSFFPLDVLYEGGKRMKENDWTKKLFREEDMKPHKNFAVCR
jgi:hypothetical protein